jgi:hypothetical protein
MRTPTPLPLAFALAATAVTTALEALAPWRTGRVVA